MLRIYVLFSWDEIRDDASFNDVSFLLHASSDRGLRVSLGLRAYRALPSLTEGAIITGELVWDVKKCTEKM